MGKILTSQCETLKAAASAIAKHLLKEEQRNQMLSWIAGNGDSNLTTYSIDVIYTSHWLLN